MAEGKRVSAPHSQQGPEKHCFYRAVCADQPRSDSQWEWSRVRHGLQGAYAGASRQTQKDRFSLIIHGVPQEDEDGGAPACVLIKLVSEARDCAIA